jgi:predicted Zn-ribbon and HTH transcriptional regulator
MTREEAKDYIREWCPYDRQEEIIKALDQEPCEDAINRQSLLDEAFEVDTKEYGRIEVVGVDAIEALPIVTPQPKYEEGAKAFQLGLAFGFGEKHDEMDKVIDEIKKVITPQPKTGEWIFVDKAHEHAHCSECDYGDVDLMNGRPHNYCPNCGAKMVEPQEGG